MKSNIVILMENCRIENEVTDIYFNHFVKKYFNDVKITYPHNSDGYVTFKSGDKNASILFEFKNNVNLSEKTEAAKVILQTIYYLKKFTDGYPDFVFIGSRKNCFVLPSVTLTGYLSCDINWKLAPSQAYEDFGNRDILISIMNNIHPYIYEISDDVFDSVYDDLVHKINNRNFSKISVSEHNISNAFDYFKKNVLVKSSSYTPQEIVNLFIHVLLDENNIYIHPKKNNVLVYQDSTNTLNEFRIKQTGYEAFTGQFKRQYSFLEKKKFTEIYDRLIEDEKRRRNGEFFTPPVLVDMSHNIISNMFGDDWKEKYTVWDVACGTKNLTRDYTFANLYTSTLFESELEISAKYNTGSTAFQFDFVNDEIAGPDSLIGPYADKLPKELKDALLEDKPIIFYLNPPYATAGNSKRDTEAKTGVSKNRINEQMNKEDIGPCSQNLYAQFIYRIMRIKQQFNLSDVRICIFSPTRFLSSLSTYKLRNEFLKHFKFGYGVQFSADCFSDTKSVWSISFTVWETGETIDKKQFRFREIEVIDGEVCEFGSGFVYNIEPEESLNNYIRSEKSKKKTFSLSSGVKVKTNKDVYYDSDRFIGCLISGGNCVEHNSENVALFSYAASIGHNGMYPVTRDNFERLCSSYAARLSVKNNWNLSHLEYKRPDTDKDGYDRFVADTVVYSLFANKSNMTSLRDIIYKDGQCNINNEFFWLSRDHLVSLYNNYDMVHEDSYQDCISSNDRFAYKYISENWNMLSDDARKLLELAKYMFDRTFRFRNDYDRLKPELQVLNWDCGYYQLKDMWKLYEPEKFQEFRSLFTDFEYEISKKAYEFGFLR